MALIIGGAATLSLNTTASPPDDAKVDYEVKVEAATIDHKQAREKCDEFAGNAKDVCLEEAKAALARTKALAEAAYENTPQARTEANMAIADADYAVAKAKCEAKDAAQKELCLKQAGSARSKAEAKASEEKKPNNKQLTSNGKSH